MVNKKVINEIYKKYRKPVRDTNDLNIKYFLEILGEKHNLECADGEIVNLNLDDFNPFKRMLIKSLHSILEFDKVIAFVFGNHIIFFDKTSDNMHIHFKPENDNFFSRLFHKK
ncbi:MAG: hypothetical protein NC402_01695 [Prevotella sp.]|nr:hypothetical protein [Prevotella sp.]MCM1075366.1 hypothetical protein [Ruminococcus sp.]